MAELTPLAEAISEHRSWLRDHSPDHLAPFDTRISANPEAGEAEAAVFRFLRMSNLRPRPFESVATGGPDFLCEPVGAEHSVVEVTTLKTSTVTSKSGLTHPALKVGAAHGFNQITDTLLRGAVKKAPQLAGDPRPRILVIITRHCQGALVMGKRAAEELLTGTTSFSGPVGATAPPKAIAEFKTITDLENSVFFKPGHEGSTIEPARQSISAVLLGVLSDYDLCLVGILHPAAAKPFEHGTLPGVPFVRLSTWPIEPGQPFSIEWVNAHASPICIPLPSSTP